MRLPNAKRAVVEELKITEYLLSLTRTEGASKARFFTRFGFTIEQWEVLAEALYSHCLEDEVVETEETVHGIKHVIFGIIRTLYGREPYIRTVRQIDHGSDFPRFVTARRERFR